MRRQLHVACNLYTHFNRPWNFPLRENTEIAQISWLFCNSTRMRQFTLDAISIATNRYNVMFVIMFSQLISNYDLICSNPLGWAGHGCWCCCCHCHSSCYDREITIIIIYLEIKMSYSAVTTTTKRRTTDTSARMIYEGQFHDTIVRTYSETCVYAFCWMVHKQVWTVFWRRCQHHLLASDCSRMRRITTNLYQYVPLLHWRLR